MTPTVYTADVVLPVSPMATLRGAGVVVRGERIAAVGPARTLLRAWSGAQRVHLEGCALLPGLVDAHTHLCWFDAPAPLGQGFAAWLEVMKGHALARTPAALAAAAEAGARDALARGVTAVGDSGPAPEVALALARAGLRGALHLEVFGPDPAQADVALAAAAAGLARLRPAAGPGRRVGLAPHAPYTVSASLLRAVIGLAAARGAPLSLHLAESAAEDAFVRRGAGPLAERLRARGVDVRPSGRSPVAWAAEVGALRPGVTLVHLTQASRRDLRRVAASGAGAVACPVSNVVLGHGAPPAAVFAQGGGPRALGTDSRASNPRPDLFEEARRAGAPLDAPGVLRLLTLGGAEVLGGADEYGALAPGRLADLVAIDLPQGRGCPIEALVATATRDHVRLTVLGGEVRHGLARLGGAA
ncbi:MAG: amidohydrolase family protein [Planctomycetes bacterium]|nr:amidohydrolase family protein [Planctomycetota bacterium]